MPHFACQIIDIGLNLKKKGRTVKKSILLVYQRDINYTSTLLLLKICYIIN